ncbi:MAG: rRNA maturation RNase YbeY [Patescibacteria group bacterium]|uniref:Endoribonuclease YbeY n=1 Tax=candidate division WWE3 bacterium TaxID=2053526 RepID=A0A955J2V1_UNCKA|nr:rRNA maturation RNase YbeY [candidate division WWE3 bacterium]
MASQLSKKPYLNDKTNILINVTLCTDTEITKQNKKYFSRDYPTDVLSFTFEDNREDNSLYLGDVLVNKDQAGRQAEEYGNSVEEEISELVAHGILHLLGVHHPDDDDHSVHGIAKEPTK